ncbi:MAG TPA: SdpI family protein [Ktedonobacteraceae bacterium]|nr:SdpI family protein [Ktedonobacteraceae bacterium]
MDATEHGADKVRPRRPAYAGAQRLSWLIIALQILVSLMTYPFMPERVPSHWNIYGQVDGYLSKQVNAILVPAMSIGIYLLLWLLMRYSPRLGQQSRRATAGVMNLIVVGILLFMLIMQLAVDAIALGAPLSIPFVVSLCLSLLFMFLGNYMGKLRRNFWAGFRTPWTLASETVWERTHRLGGWLMVLGGLVGVVLSFIPALRLWGVIGIVALIIIVPTIYSFVLYQRLLSAGREPLSPPFEDGGTVE